MIAGGGDSALDYVMGFHQIASDITLIHRRKEFKGVQDSVNKVMSLVDQGEVKFNMGTVKKIVDNGKKKRLWASDMDMVNYWFQETVVGYDILKSMGIETYQWTLLGIEELSDLLKMAHEWNQLEMELEIKK